MRISQRVIKLLVIVASIALLILTGCWFAYWATFDQPLETFREQELTAIPYFDALNRDVLSELPLPPEGVQLISQGTGGILSPTNLHGRRMVLRYEIVSIDNRTAQDILTYYTDWLTPNGWEFSSSSFGENAALYWRDTACIEIFVLLAAREIDIDIWNDFLAQDFSPVLPPTDSLRLYDYGETDILTCPPK